MATLPKAPAEAPPKVTAASLVWCYDGAQIAARSVERSEGRTITLQGATGIRTGHVFTEEQRYPFLVLRESTVVGMGPMPEDPE